MESGKKYGLEVYFKIMQPLAYVDDPCLKTAIMSIPNRSKMGWTRRLPEMTLRDDINVVFTRAMPTSLLRRSCTASSIDAVDLVVYSRLGFGQNTFIHREICTD